MILVQVQPGDGGFARRRAGRGFTYVGANGRRITAPDTLERIRALAIPPAWAQVWIAAEENAQIQATGVDDAGRTQYLYHPLWRELRDEEKFVRSIAFAQSLPALRRAVTRDLAQRDDGRRRALAVAVRLMDRAGLRVGGAEYAEENGSFGAATLQRRHVSVDGDHVRLVFNGKSGNEWDVTLTDTRVAEFFEGVPRRPRTGPAICHPVQNGRRREWKGISGAEINAYLAHHAGPGFTAKDFRTWQGTVAAARALARSARAGDTSPSAVRAAIETAAVWLHNTPAVARGSYVNPRVVALFEKGRAVNSPRASDNAVLDLLT